MMFQYGEARLQIDKVKIKKVNEEMICKNCIKEKNFDVKIDKYYGEL
jgi:protein-arginine kinase activator protein McsA